MNMELDQRIKIKEQYTPDTTLLLKYLPWLMEKKETEMMRSYNGDDGQNSFAIPVYDSTLMSFVKTAQGTIFMNRNYPYVYSRKRMYTAADELKAIEEATLRDVDVLGGILSKYILGGMTKGAIWPEGVRNGVYEALLTKLKRLILSVEN